MFKQNHMISNRKWSCFRRSNARVIRFTDEYMGKAKSRLIKNQLFQESCFVLHNSPCRDNVSVRNGVCKTTNKHLYLYAFWTGYLFSTYVLTVGIILFVINNRRGRHNMVIITVTLIIQMTISAIPLSI